MKRVLVTGASGCIGRHTLSLLTARGYDVYALSFTNKEPLDPNVHPICCDLLQADEVSTLLREIRPQYLLHFAWHTKHGMLWEAKENLDWVKASLHLIQEFAHFGGKRAVVAGSCAEYSWSHEFFSEDVTPCEASSLYGKSKNSLRLLLESHALKKTVSLAWGRIFFLYGPYENEKKLVASMITSMLRGQNFTLQNGNLIRDFLHVSDIASAFVAILESELQGVINIASGQGISLKAVGELVQRSLNKTDLLQVLDSEWDSRPSKKIVADVSRLKNTLNWNPQFNLEKGLLDTIQWWSQSVKN